METVILSLLILYFFLACSRPDWGIVAILAILPAYQIRFPVAGIPTTFLEWMILLLAAATLIRAFGQFRKYRQRIVMFFQSAPALMALIGLLLLSALAGVLASPELIRALGIYKAYFAEGAIFFLLCVIHLDEKKKILMALQALGFLTIALAGFGLYQFFTLAFLPPAWWGPGLEPRRVVSVYSYPNAVALLVAPILALFTALLASKSPPLSSMEASRLPDAAPLGSLAKTARGAGDGWFSKKFLITVVVAGMLLLVLTFSRGAWIGYLVSVIFLLSFTKYKKFLLLALILGIAALLIVPASRARLLPAFSGADPAGLERLKLMQGALAIIGSNPLWGSGLAGFRDWYGTLRQANTDEILNYPHNFFLNFWVETGLFGLAAVVGMLAWTGTKAKELYRQHLQSRPLVIAIVAAWVALLVHGQFDAPFFKNDLSIVFWFLLALLPITGMNVQHPPSLNPEKML